MAMLHRLASRRLLLGWMLGLLTAVVGGLIVGGLFLTGLVYDTGADSPHSKVVAWAIHMTMINSVKRQAEPVGRPRPNQAAFLAGARVYEAHCIECHGGPGVDRAAWVSAMLPTPPFIVDARAHWTHAQLHHIVHDGVKLTGMPAWGEVLPAQDIANVVMFVEGVPDLTPDQFADIRRHAQVNRAIAAVH